MSQRILIVALTAVLSAAFLAACGAVERQAADDTNDEPTTEVDDADDGADDAVVDDEDDDVANGEQVIDVVLEDHEIDMESSAQSGDITFEVTNDGSVPHGIVVQEGTDDEGEFLQSLTLDPGESGTMEINLEAGEYTIFCPMGEHRDEHGMELEFTVEDDDAVVEDDDDEDAVADAYDVTLSDHEIDMPEEVSAGDVTFEVTNDGEVPHGIAFEDEDGELIAATTVEPGETESLEVTLEEGTYTVFCPIGEHRDDYDMEVELTVTEEDAVTDDDDDIAAEETLEVTLSDHEIDMPEEVSAGDVTFEVTNDGEVPHGIAIEDEDGELVDAVTVEPGESDSIDVSLEEGTYTIFCPIGEHRDDYDMEVELTVTEDDAVMDDDDEDVAEDSYEIVLTDYEIDMPEEVSAGEITFEVSNEGDSRHGVAFQELDEDGEPGAFVASTTLTEGESTTIEVELEEGEYIVFCPIGEHREDHDMEVELTVTADDAVADDDEADATDVAESPIDVTLSDYEIDMPEAIAAGEVTFEITNDSEGSHGFTIKEALNGNDDDDAENGDAAVEAVEAIQGTITVDAGDTESLDVELDAGTYIVYCQIGEHREEHDMELEITVE